MYKIQPDKSHVPSALQALRIVKLYSGSSFDIGHLSPGYFSANDETCDATVISEEAKLFRCSVANLAKLCTHGQVKDAVEGLLISALTDIAKQEYSSQQLLQVVMVWMLSLPLLSLMKSLYRTWPDRHLQPLPGIFFSHSRRASCCRFVHFIILSIYRYSV